MRKKLSLPKKEETAMFFDNKKQIDAYNFTTTSALLFIVGCMFGVLSIFCLCLPSFRTLVPYVGFIFLLSVCFYCIHQFMEQSKYLLLEIYICFTLLYITAFVTSFYFSKTSVSVLVLGLQILMPIVVIDRLWRVNSYVLIFYVIYMSGVCLYKTPLLIADEFVNITGFTVIGIFLGNHLRKMKLENFEYRRKAYIDENIDFLTRLYNRKKLFDDVQTCETNKKKPQIIGIMMLDVDYFKAYNDTFGHLIGDSCLQRIGASLLNFARENNIDVYRFGGEEFVALIYEDQDENCEHLARRLGRSIYDLHIPCGKGQLPYVSISIGLRVLENDETLDYNAMMKDADEALYKAKHLGRNQVIKCTRK